jgi:alpha-glucosidase
MPFRKILFSILFTLFIFHLSVAQWTSIGNVDKVDKTSDGIIISAKSAKVQVSILSADVIRVRLSKDGNFLPDSSWAVVQRTLGSKAFSFTDTNDEVRLTTSTMEVRIQKSPCRFSFYDSNGNLINQDEPSKGMAWSGNEVQVWKTMPQDETYYGFGEKAGGLERKWKAMSMWNSDIPGYRADTDPLYETIPFFYGIRNGKAYGIFFDNTYYSYFNMGKEHQFQYSFGAVDGELNYYFINGPTPNDVLKRFSALTGRIPLPPRWAVAYQQCRYSYYPDSRVREIASTFRTKKIPCDVIYFDIHYMDDYRCFTWDEKRFPNPKKLINDLAKDGFKTVVIIDPGIKKEPGYWVYDEGIRGEHFVKYPDGNYYVGKVWPGECVFPDFTKQSSRDWWGTLYKGLIDDGIKGFWNDMNEPAVFDVPGKTFDLSVIHDDNGMKTDHRKNHNVYGMLMAQGTYEGVMKLRPNERPFVLTRASYAGGNRYAAAWTGDNISSWDHLEMAIPMCLNLSISGQSFVGTDIGGFIGSPSGELFARWLQLGTFTPLMRTHTEIGSADQEPWSYGDEYEAINRKSIELRYKLLPYIYTQFYLASTTGLPIMRPVVFDYPDDDNARWRDHEFLFGDALYIAPVTSPGTTKRRVFLPKGEWYNYWTEEHFTGPKDIWVDAPIDRIPIFVKSGAIIPMQQVVQFSDQETINPLTLEIYPSETSSTILYEDDGVSFNYQKGEYCLRSIECSKSSDRIEVVLSKPKGSFRPPARKIITQFHNVTKQPVTVSLEEKKLRQTEWIYDASKKLLKVTFEDMFQKQTITVIY